MRGIRLNGDLTGWNFSGQNLTNADLWNSTLKNADLSGTNLKNAYLDSIVGLGSALFTSDSIYNEWTVFPAGFDLVMSGLTLMQSPVGDFNANDLLDVDDLDLLAPLIHHQPSHMDAMFDVNEDSTIDLLDLQTWVTDLKHTHFGDADLDGAVDLPDFVSLANHFGQSGGWGDGDFDLSGDVQFPDFVILANNFGKISTMAAVPEPGAYAVWVLGILLVALRRGPHGSCVRTAASR